MIKYLAIFVVILLLLLGVVGYFASDFKQKYDRMEENVLAGLGKNPNTLNFTPKEFKQYLKESEDRILDRVSDSLKMKIRPRNVSQINNYKYYYVDTTITEIPIMQIDNAYPFKFNNGCMVLEGTFDINDSKLLLTRKEFQDSIIDVSGGKRELKMKWLFGGLRIGKMQPFSVTLSNCGGVISKKEINVGKQE